MYKKKISHLTEPKKNPIQSSSNEVKQRMKKIDTDNNGKVSSSEFNDYLNKNERKTKLGKQITDAELDDEISLFVEAIDTNENQIIEFEEMEPLISAQLQAERQPEQHSDDELKSYFKSVLLVLNLIKVLNRITDINGNNYVTKDELIEQASNYNTLDEINTDIGHILSIADTNEDNKISFQEYRDSLKKQIDKLVNKTFSPVFSVFLLCLMIL